MIDRDEAEQVGDPDPTVQGELDTLEAELREAIQHQRAALERMEETQAEVRAVLERARKLLDR